MDLLIEKGEANPEEDWTKERYFTSVEWDESCANACEGFIEWMDEELKPLAGEYGENNVRILMGFDS
jgi:hypothetical protein